MHTVELLPDEALDAGIRALWERLRAAGLPSLADHPHPTNRPHLTLVTAASLGGLAPIPLPLAVTLGPARLLGRALVRTVAPTPDLCDLQARVWESLSQAWPPPREWVPHLSLALRSPAEALERVAGLPSVEGLLVAARTYDTVSRTVTGLERLRG